MIILVVDDDRIFLESIEDSLCSQGFTVFTADCSEQGLGLALDKKPDYILTDILMPNTDGIDFLIRIRNENCCDNIIVMSGSNNIVCQRYRDMLRAFDNIPFLKKPFYIKELVELMNI